MQINQFRSIKIYTISSTFYSGKLSIKNSILFSLCTLIYEYRNKKKILWVLMKYIYAYTETYDYYNNDVNIF